MNPFHSLKLSDPLLRALESKSYKTPTPIQVQAIPPTLAGHDILGCAQTGTGKTAAFALPILQRLDKHVPHRHGRTSHPRALIIAPTRELAQQIVNSFGEYGRYTTLRATAVYGGVGLFQQTRILQNGIDILVATPGRLMDLMEQKYVSLQSVEVLVLDEADRLLDMGFIEPIRFIASQIRRERQTLLFSATMPREILHLANALQRDPVEVRVAPTEANIPKIEQSVYVVHSKVQKEKLLEHMLVKGGMNRVIIFTKTKHGADRLCKGLRSVGVASEAIHGNKVQGQRDRALARFKTGQSQILVATDVAARGLDVDGITHVIQFDLPRDPEAYIHRIGRTGRAGATGIAIAFCEPGDRGSLRNVERLIGQRVPVAPMPAVLERIQDREPVATIETPRYEIQPRPQSHAHGHSNTHAHGHASTHTPSHSNTHNREHGHSRSNSFEHKPSRTRGKFPRHARHR